MNPVEVISKIIKSNRYPVFSRRMRTLYLFLFIVYLSPGICYAQENKDLDKAKKIVQAAQELKDRYKKDISDRIKDNLKAVKKFKEALEYMTASEEYWACMTLLSLAETYMELGADETYYVDHIREFAKYVSDKDLLIEWLENPKPFVQNIYTIRSPIFYDLAIEYLDIVMRIAVKQDYRDGAIELRTYIDENMREYRSNVYQIQGALRTNLEVEEKKNEITKRRRDYASFFLIGAGTGSTYGTMGAKASYYMAPNGVSFLGSIGTDKTKWAAGIGIGFANTYKHNLHLHVLAGNRWFPEIEAYETALNLSATLNLDIYKRIGVSIDGGCWATSVGNSEMLNWGWSIGVYYKFSK
jgi:tetratricopeptide (TPR) repeat protein